MREFRDETKETLKDFADSLKTIEELTHRQTLNHERLYSSIKTAIAVTGFAVSVIWTIFQFVQSLGVRH
jgi:hypothetical protein